VKGQSYTVKAEDDELGQTVLSSSFGQLEVDVICANVG
jgi:hypothetical protein